MSVVTRKIEFDISTNISLKSTGNEFEVVPAVLVSIDPPRWIANTSVIRLRLGGTTSFETTLSRYPLFQVLSILVPISVFLIIFTILPNFAPARPPIFQSPSTEPPSIPKLLTLPSYSSNNSSPRLPNSPK